jgi:hypothetical protein
MTIFRRFSGLKELVHEYSDFSAEDIEFLTRLNKCLAKERKKEHLCMEEGKTAEFSELITLFSLTSCATALFLSENCKDRRGRGEDKEADV